MAVEVSAMKGSAPRVTVCQPKKWRSVPELNEASETVPKTRKSLSPWTLPFSASVWHSVRSVVPPTKRKFHPSPRQKSPVQ